MRSRNKKFPNRARKLADILPEIPKAKKKPRKPRPRIETNEPPPAFLKPKKPDPRPVEYRLIDDLFIQDHWERKERVRKMRGLIPENKKDKNLDLIPTTRQYMDALRLHNRGGLTIKDDSHVTAIIRAHEDGQEAEPKHFATLEKLLSHEPNNIPKL